MWYERKFSAFLQNLAAERMIDLHPKLAEINGKLTGFGHILPLVWIGTQVQINLWLDFINLTGAIIGNYLSLYFSVVG